MSHRNRNSGELPLVTPEDRDLRKLFSHAGLRERPPPEFERQAREDLYAQWSKMTLARKRRRRFGALAIAAAVLVALLALELLTSESPSRPVELATVVRQVGDIMTRGAPTDTGSSGPSVGATLHSGQEVSTGADGYLAVRWHSGVAIRLDKSTRLGLLSEDRIELLSGRIYVDTGRPANGAVQRVEPRLTVTSSLGDITHRGTQYMAALAAAGLRVTVREGTVEVTSGNDSDAASRGEQLVVAVDGAIEVRSELPYGEYWRWVEAVSPPFRLDGKTVYQVLDQIGRETGHLIRYGDATAKRVAREAVLQGTLDMEPLTALELVLQSADLQAHRSDGSIVVKAH